MLQLLREDCSFRYPPLSVARYSFIQLSELWQCGMNDIAKGKASKRQENNLNPSSLELRARHSNRYATVPQYLEM